MVTLLALPPRALFSRPLARAVDSAQAPQDQQALHVHAVDTSSRGESAAAAGEAPAPKQPFVVVSGMISLSGTEDGGDSAKADGVDAPVMTAEGDLSAEAETKAGDTATKAPDSPSSVATAHAVDFEPVPGEVLRVGVAGSRSLSPGDDAVAGVADSDSAPPAKAAVAPKEIPGDLAADVTAETSGSVAKSPDMTAETSDNVAKSPDTSSRGAEMAMEGKLGTKEPSDKVESEAATKPVRHAAGVD